MVEKIKVKVDGREIEVPKTMTDPISGKQIPTTMIQAAALANVDIPHYCYHPKFPCRAIAACASWNSARRRSARTASR